MFHALNNAALNQGTLELLVWTLLDSATIELFGDWRIFGAKVLESGDHWVSTLTYVITQLTRFILVYTCYTVSGSQLVVWFKHVKMLTLE